MVIIGLILSLFVSAECDYEDEERKKRCEEEHKDDDKKFDDALKFALSFIIISSITIFLGISYNKKLIILSSFCLLIKISLLIGYIIYLSKLIDDDRYISLVILPEIISDIFFL